MYTFAQYLDISVAFTPPLEGGGISFGQEFINVVAQRMGRRQHVFELCAGPGFIGFSLLAHGLCEKLTLADINPEAVAACQETIRRNKLEDRCSVYLSDVLDRIPATERWDLVVGNPPHWPYRHEPDFSLLKHDIGLEVHHRFFQQVRPFLMPGASVLLQENARATTARDFESMANAAAFRLVDVFKENDQSNYYFILYQ